MSASFITREDFAGFLDHLTERSHVFVPVHVEKAGRIALRSRQKGEQFAYPGVRASQSLKPFLFAAREKVAEYPSSTGAESLPPVEHTTVVGVAACDIVALKTLDAVFVSEDYTDGFYSERRANTVIISADCTDPYETCCCTLLGNKPHVESGYDLNISKVEGGFIVEPGSEFGKKLLQEHSSLFRTATAEMISARAATRDATTRKVEAINREMGLTRRRQEIIRSAPGDPAWYPHVRTCVECAACLFSCPTCHCFLLYDQKGRQAFERAKAWDVCIYAGYSRMAGGGSPRPFVVERFRHRFRHKYDQIVERYGMEGCSGCGRCIEGCPGLIDFRKVFRALDRMKPAQTATKAARI